ncbi:POK11 protein, partial [Alectura lathami]|nr:POK11 protein [Alectura lathami]
LQWKSQKSVWVEQRPLKQERLQIVNQLVQEQLEAGHIVPSNSPWKTPIFTIPKKSGKWRLLHDLRAINQVMQSMSSLQPGLPSPPEGWDLLIIDLKDCFFTIPLHPEDAEKFAFPVPSLNKAEPAKRHHWVVLPQGMKNSPTMCQVFVAWALRPVRKQFPHLIIYLYTDDILIAGDNLQGEEILTVLEHQLEKRGLKIAPEKVQRQSPWKYLGWTITDSSIRLLHITSEIKTLNDAQKLVGDIQWVRHLCGITNDEIKPLLQLLSTTTHGNEARQLNSGQQHSLERITEKITLCHAQRITATQPIDLLIINSGGQRALALMSQWDPKIQNPLKILEWVFTSVNPKKTMVTRGEILSQLIRKGRHRIQEIAGVDPQKIVLPLTHECLEWLLRHSLPLQMSLEDFTGDLSNTYPAHRLLNLIQNKTIETFPVRSETPVEACIWQEQGSWKHHLIQGRPGDSLQTLEFAAVLWALTNWSETPLNIVSDSLYVVGIVWRSERATLKEVDDNHLGYMLQCLVKATDIRAQPYFTTHIRSHQSCMG